jgi:holo-[acyl-carrier protein] synthase
MDIIGHGVDIVEITRLVTLLENDSDAFAGWFTASELEFLGEKGTRADAIAGRIAAKEAVVKALGTGFVGDVSWQDIEIVSRENGAPVVVLSGGAADIAREIGIVRILVTMSHDATVAIASAIALGPPGSDHS